MGGEKRFFKDWLLYCLVLCFVSLSLGLSVPVFAQDEEDKDNEFTLEEIVVTAEKREAVLQKVPMDITVVRPDDMERFNVHQMSELQKLIPELSTAEGAAGTGFLNLTVRGNESNYWNPTSEPTVAVNIDGMPLTRSNGLEGKFYDLERIEMLAGPQGTLYGRGSTAGSLSLISKRPDIGQFGGNIQLEYGSFNRRRLEGALNIPATDKLAFRLSGRSIQRDAQDDVDISVQDMWGMRGSINWEPTDRQSLVITVDTDATNNRGGYGYQGVYFKAFGDVEIVANPDPTLTDEFRKYASGGTVSTPYKARWFYTEGDDDQQQRSDSWGTNFTYEHELDWGWLTAKYGYRSMTQFLSYVAAQQPTLQPLGSYTTLSWYDTDTMDPETGEITPAGTGPDDGYGEVNWYYTTYTVQQDPATGDDIPVTQLILYAPQTSNYVMTLSNTVSRTSNFETYFNSAQSIADGDKMQWIAGGLLTNDSVTEIARVIENVHNSWDLREYALYGQLQYAPFAGLTISGGYRYLWDTKKFEGVDYGTGLMASGPDAEWGIYAARPQDPSLFNHYTYKVGYNTYQGNISWQATEDIMTYVSYSKGMKTIELGRDGRPVPPEQMNSVEAAVRSRFFNGRLQTNLTAYYQEYKNRNDWYTTYQCRIPLYDDDGDFTGCKAISGTADNDLDRVESSYGVLSPGGSKGHGGRADITWRITRMDTLSINASYEHNEYDDYNVGDAMREAFERYWGVGNVHSSYLATYDQDKTGQEFGGRPWRGNITYTRMWYIGTDMLTTSLTGFYEGEGLDQYKHRNQDNETIWPGNPDYFTLSASINYSSTKWVPEGCRWTFSVYGSNILDNDELASITWYDGTEGWFQTWSFPENSGYISGTFLQPRTLGASFTLNF